MFRSQALKKFKHAFKQCMLTSCLMTSIAGSANAAIDTSRSLLVTDFDILDDFPFEDVMQSILTSAGDNVQTPQNVLDNWPISTNNCSFPAEFNGFPSRCPGVGIGTTDIYEPIAIINRFDLASVERGSCGEYRIAYAAKFGFGIQINFVIFEANLPNPTPSLGLEGCRPVVDFWADLSNEDNNETRAQALRDFYFNGLPGFSPIFHTANFEGSENNSGQIRFNQRLSRLTTWSFFEFATTAENNSLGIVQSTIKENAFEDLSSDSSEFPSEATLFQNAVLAGLSVNGEGLLANSFTELTFDLPREVETGSRLEDVFGDELDGGVIEHFDNTSNFASDIQAQLDSVGSSLTPDQVIARVNVMSCGGCHNNAADLGQFEYDATDIFVEMLAAEVGFTDSALHVEAEDFSSMNGVQTETTSDVGGGLNVGWLDDGDWMRYEVSVPSSGSGEYDIHYRISSNGTGSPAGTLRLENADSGEVFGTLNFESTGGWQNWTTLTQRVSLDNGLQTLAIVVDKGAWNINWFDIEPIAPTAFPVKNPLKNVFLPARLINMEGFLASCPTCTSTKIEAEDFAAMSGIQTETTSDVGGGLNVGWTDAGDWMAYDVSLPANAGDTYRVSYRVASDLAEGGALQLELPNGTLLASLDVPSTSGWQNWATISHDVTIPAGTAGLTIAIQSGGWNLNWFEVEAVEACTSDCVSENMLTNGDFSNGGTGWETYVDASTDANLWFDTQFNDARTSMHNGGTEAWHVQLRQSNLTIENGKTYRLTFDHTTASKVTNATYTVLIEEDGGDYTSYSPSWVVNSNPGNQTFTMEFTMTQATDNDARVTFNLGGTQDDPRGPGKSIFIDNVELVEVLP